MKYILFAFQVFPSVLAAVRAVEDVIPLAGAGKAKLSMVVGIVEAVFEAAKDEVKGLDKDIAASAIINIINKIVAALNGIGVFTKAA